MTTSTVPNHESPRFPHMPTRQLIDLLILFSKRPHIHPLVIERTVDPLRTEVRRREVRGFDDPFDSPYPEVTW
jgi:hypothetical protein